MSDIERIEAAARFANLVYLYSLIGKR